MFLLLLLESMEERDLRGDCWGCGLWREERKFELLQYLLCSESFEHPEFLEIVIWSFRCPTVVLTVNYSRVLLLVDCYTICPLNMPCLSLSPGKQELILFFHITPKTSSFFCLVCSSGVSPDDYQFYIVLYCEINIFRSFVPVITPLPHPLKSS